MQIKARNEVGFMPAFMDCSVVPGSQNRNKNSFLRRSKMQEFHSGQEVEVTEEVMEFKPTMIHFRRFDSSAEVFNTISKDQETGQLYLTFSYHVKLGKKTGSEEEVALYQEAQERMANYDCLTKTLARIRRMVTDGTIPS